MGSTPTPGTKLESKISILASHVERELCLFLDHSSLAVTTTYLRRLEGQEDKNWEKVAEAIGIS